MTCSPSAYCGLGYYQECATKSDYFSSTVYYQYSTGLGKHKSLDNLRCSGYTSYFVNHGPVSFCSVRYPYSSSEPHITWAPCYSRSTTLTCPKGWGNYVDYYNGRPGCNYGSYYPNPTSNTVITTHPDQIFSQEQLHEDLLSFGFCIYII